MSDITARGAKRYKLARFSFYSHNAGADLDEMVTDFRNNERRRRGEIGGMLPHEFFFLSHS